MLEPVIDTNALKKIVEAKFFLIVLFNFDYPNIDM